MVNNRLKKWSQNCVLEDLLLKNPHNHPYNINNSMSGVHFGGELNKLGHSPNLVPKGPSQSMIPKAIIINVCSSKAVTDKRRLIPILLALELITGQRGLLAKAKYSSAAFRLKKGMEIGVKITLKKSNMWNFLDKLTHIILPSLIYFNKLKNNKISYDKCGNLAIGLEDISIFPEMDWLRELQHPLALGPGDSSFITGADILIITRQSKKGNQKGPQVAPAAYSQPKLRCGSSSLQLFQSLRD